MWTPEKIKDLRRRIGQSLGKRTETQEEFCRRLCCTPDALQHWEQGRGEPGPMAQELLRRIEEDLETGKISGQLQSA